MGTPEDVAAEKYFTPPTLTEMLVNSCRWDKTIHVDTAKKIFKKWLRTVDLPDSSPESRRRVLIILVDEP